MSVNIVGDIAGRYDELMLLLNKMPKADNIILVGDLNDRHIKSRQVIEWAMSTPNVITLHSNHGDFLIELYYKMLGIVTGECYYSTYSVGDLFNKKNGCVATLISYGIEHDFEKISIMDLAIEVIKKIPKSHIEWLKTRPIEYIEDNLIVTHAPLIEGKIKHGSDTRIGYNITDRIWNRCLPYEIEGKFQVFGHNANFGLRWFGNWAICIDTSWQEVLTGLHWPVKQIYQVPYIQSKGATDVNEKEKSSEEEFSSSSFDS